ncbi:MAG: translation initiation factor IF-1 [Candidatus Pacebacteria bacterium]|nr:translation initiation factor IF-1 [Candidatus Paceibacterota bacterium]NUQ57468.1 translation initiation factor IF-1 [Candidatus Paceibacter sp.]
MADRSDKIAIGTVIEALPNATFRVSFEDGSETIAYLSGRMRINRIKVLVGDKVKVELSQYGQAKGRITQRL